MPLSLDKNPVVACVGFPPQIALSARNVARLQHTYDYTLILVTQGDSMLSGGSTG